MRVKDEAELSALLARGVARVAGKPFINEAKMEEFLAAGATQLAWGSTPKPKKPRRYRNEPVVVDGQKFDSRHEAAQFAKLQLLERAGKISNLKRQVPYVLAPAVRLDGRMKPALKIILDFTYERDGVTVAADAKSEITRKKDVYRVKKHLLRHVWGLEIEEM